MKNRKPKYCKKANPKENSGRVIPTFLILAMIFVILAFMARGCSKTDQPDPEAIPPHPIETTEFAGEIKNLGIEAEEESTGAEETEPAETEHIHDYDVTDEKEVECCTDGYVIYTCSCGDYFTKKIEARGYHNWAKWETIKVATTKSTGIKQRTCKDCSKVEEKTIDKLSAETAPTETKPPATEPPVTNPQVTEPPEIEAPACAHNWQTVYHPEEGHHESYVVCTCGYRCQTTAEWITHTKSYDAAEALLNHGGNGSVQEYVTDTPAYTEWVCTKCGAVTTSQP